MTANYRHLNLVAVRVFGAEAAAEIDKIFSIAIENGGLEEEDFRREPGVSFNPRPARVGLILINDLKVHDPLIVRAGVLAPVVDRCPDEAKAKIESSMSGGKQAIETALAARLPLDRIEKLEGSAREAAAKIAAALFLDRMRHFHQSDEWKTTEDRTVWLKRVEPYIRFSSWGAPQLTPYFEAWCARLSRTTRAA